MPLPKPVTKTGGTFLDRPFSELINERAMDLAELKMKMFEAGMERRDDIALVRYLASFGTVKNTMEALRAAEQISQEKASLLEAAEQGRPLACAERVEPFQKVHSWKVSEDSMWYIVRVNHIDCKKLLKSATPQEVTDYGLHLCRTMWLWVDQTSRRCGRIRKYDVVLDFDGYSFTSWEKVPPAAYRNAMNKMSEMSEVLHPLSMGSSIILGMPGAAVARRLIEFSKPFLPKSLTEAQLCPGNRQGQSIATCPFISQRIPGGAGAVPTFLGGSCTMSGMAQEAVASASTGPCKEELDQFEAILAKTDDTDEAAKLAFKEGLGVEAAGPGRPVQPTPPTSPPSPPPWHTPTWLAG